MKILLTGATGFIGKKLALRLFQEGHELVVLSRNAKNASRLLGLPCQTVQCDLLNTSPPPEAFSNVDAVIHLAGEPVAGGRWTVSRRKMIFDSRIIGTRNLVKAMKSVGKTGPQVFISTSAIGFYGDRENEVMNENSKLGTGFLAEVCQAWEAEAEKAGDAQTRVATLRLGVVMGYGGGAIEKMLTPFSNGLGVTMGNGNQWMSWVHIDDVVNALCFALRDQRAVGVFNVVSPNPVNNKRFTLLLAKALNSNSRLTVPGLFLRLGLGEMASLFLGSAKVLPEKLNSLGFIFSHPTLEEALKSIFLDFPCRIFEETQFINKPINEVFSFFCKASNLEVLTPPWLNFKIISQTDKAIKMGTEIEYRLRVHGLPLHWRSKIEHWLPNEAFADTQLKGPYSKWFHMHQFQELRGGTLMKDRVSYRLPLGSFGALVAGRLVSNDIEKIFSFRTKKILEEFK